MNQNKIQIQTFQKVYQNILKYFPFINNHSLKKFTILYKKYAQKLQNQSLEDRAFFEFLEIFLTKLKNSHTKLGNYPGKQFFFPKNHWVRIFDQKFYLFNKQKLVGKILEIDGIIPIKKLKICCQRIPTATSQNQKYRGSTLMLAKKSAEFIEIKIKQTDNIKILKLKCFPFKWSEIKLSNLLRFKIINFNIGYLVIKTWDNKYFKDITNFINTTINTILQKKLSGLIIDLRGNTGGNSSLAKELASHFFYKKLIFNKTKIRSSKTKIIYQTKTHYLLPQNPYLNIPITILIDKLCFSSCEYFIAGMKDNKRAILIGETTGGGSGNPIAIDIPYGKEKFYIQISTWQYYRKNGSLLERKGVEPHIFINNTLNDILEKKDKVLETAIKILDKTVSYY